MMIAAGQLKVPSQSFGESVAQLRSRVLPKLSYIGTFDYSGIVLFDIVGNQFNELPNFVCRSCPLCRSANRAPLTFQ